MQRIQKYLMIEGKNYLVIQSSLTLNESNSSGPLLNKKRKVIEMISSKVKNKKEKYLRYDKKSNSFKLSY